MSSKKAKWSKTASDYERIILSKDKTIEARTKVIEGLQKEKGGFQV